MLRMTRMKKVLRSFAGFDEWRMRMSGLITFCAVSYLCHLLACTWYYLGNTSMASDGREQLGWVQRILTNSNDQCPLCPDISMINKYGHSLYTLLKMGDSICVTGSEKAFAIFSESVIILVQGMLAGMMSQLMMSRTVGEQDYLIKIAQLRAWMKARNFNAERQKRIMKHFIAKVSTHASGRCACEF